MLPRCERKREGGNDKTKKLFQKAVWPLPYDRKPKDEGIFS